MKKAIFIILGVLVVVVLGVLALIYIPSPKFEPVAYEPITPDYWPTEGFLTSTPEEQGMESPSLSKRISSLCKPVSAAGILIYINGKGGSR